MGNFTVKIKCESKEIKDAIMAVFFMSKGQLVHNITKSLEAKGIFSDTKIKIQCDEMIITQKSGDKGFVFVSHGIGVNTVGYDTLVAPCKYMVVKDGAVTIFVKMVDNIDRAIARYEDLDEAIANINSNDVETAYKNIVTPQTGELLPAPEPQSVMSVVPQEETQEENVTSTN